MRIQSVLGRLVPAASLLALLVACLDLIGWGLGLVSLVRILPLPGSGIMMPNTAIGLLLCGAALGLLRRQDVSPWRRGLSHALASAAVLLGGLTLSEYLFGVDLGIDLLLFGETVRGVVSHLPGRPAPMTAFCFCLTGLALRLLDAETDRGRRPAQLLALIVGALASMALLGYVYLEEGLFAAERVIPSLPFFTPIAVHTALTLLMLSLGILGARPDRGLMKLITGDDAGGFMARRLLPVAILVPAAVGGLRLLGERLGLYGTTGGVAIFVVSTTTILLIVIAWNAAALQSLDVRRREAEQVLRESEERFRAAYENAPIGMALVGLDGRFLNVNRSLCEIVGYSEKELLTKTFQDITYPEDLEPDLASARRLLQGEINAYQLEKRYRHKRGQLVSVLLTGSLVRDSQGGPLHFIAQIQDISARKRLEQDWRFLAEAGPQLAGSLDPQAMIAIVARLVVPAMADWCVIDLLDDEGRVLAVEGVAARVEKEGTLQAMLTTYPHDPARHGHLVARVLRTGEPVLLPEIPQSVLEETAEDERHLELLRQLEPLSGMVVPLLARGHTLGAIIFATSESGRRYDARSLMLAEELARRAALAIDNARLYRTSEQATRSRDEVLRIVAHDLRTPLQAITLSAQTLLKRLPEESGTERKPLHTIQRAVARADRLIQDLLDIARIEAGRISVERRPEVLAPLLKEVLELHRALVEAKSLQLTLSVPEDCPSILADRDRLLQILSNLLGNALKFTPEGGWITLRVEQAGDMMRFSVSDTGPGISAESLPHLFDPFWQARVSRKEGAGLGLAIVKGLVEAHGGRVWVESKPGAGSTFFFTLPLVAPAEEHLAHPA
jgi:PAS domain S-box-containing protein